MAHIYVFSPAGAVSDKASFKRGVARLRQLGHEVEVDPDALRTHQRFAGTDAQRTAAFARAAASGADWAIISRGGYGTTRLLDHLPYAAIQASIKKGMQWMGYSDFTAFQCALWQARQSPSWAGVSVVGDLGTEAPDDITLACLEDVLNHTSEGTGWRLKRADRPQGDDPGAAKQGVPEDAQLARQATLWGGNLTMLTSLMGTRHFPQIKKGVLFLEDVGEHPYRIERMLNQLLQGGVIQAQQLVVLGQFTQYQLHAMDRGFNMAKVVGWLRSQTRTPVITGLPFGHVATKVCLPFGVKVDVATQGQDALILWGHTH